VFSAGYNVAMVTYCVTKMILRAVLTGDWAVFDTMIVASIAEEWC